MPTVRAPNRRFVLGAAIVAVLFACVPREDELQCEEAVAHLSHCCPDFDSRPISCEYITGCGSSTRPAISIDEAECIRKESCEALIATGVCDRAASARAKSYTDSLPNSPSSPAVCP